MAIKDPTTTQPGGLNSLIGVDTSTVYDAAPSHLTVGATITTTRLGGTTVGVEDPRYPGKALSLRQTSGSVAEGGVVVAGWLNRTGTTVASGKYVVCVAV